LIFPSLQGYRRAWLSSDLIAGVMLAAIAIPEQLATARLAGMPAQTGLYAFVAGSLAFAAFGANRYLSSGADSTIAPIFAGSLAALAASGSPEYLGLVGFVALVAGALLLLAGLLRAGWIADLLSVPVTVGFLAGISVHIIAGQLPAFLGVAEPAGPLPLRLLAILGELPSANWYAVAVGGIVLAATLGAERVNPRIPGALIGLAAAGVLAAAGHFAAHGVAMLGALPAGVPHLTVPALRDLPTLLRALPVAAIVAVVCMMQTAATVRSFPPAEGGAAGLRPSAAGLRPSEQVSADFAAIGAGSLVAALLGSFAVDASPPRTAVAQASGGRSQAAGLVAVLAIVLLIAFGAALPAYLPRAALAGVLIFIGLRIFRLGDMLDIARRGGAEIRLVVAGALLVIVLPIETGMLLSIGLSLAQGIYIVARPPSTQLLRVPGTTIWWPPQPDSPGERVAGVLVFSPAAPISFTNAHYLIGRLRAAVAAAPEPVKLIVLECEGVIYVDYTGSQEFQSEIAALRDTGIAFSIARLEDPGAQASAARTGLLTAIGAANTFKSVNEALLAAGK
jgi:MFS superfamily sulfate permease-like transporter